MIVEMEPAPRANLLGMEQELDWVGETQACGPGIWVRLDHDCGRIAGFTSIMEREGWYVDSIDQGHDDLVVVLMPVGAGDE